MSIANESRSPCSHHTGDSQSLECESWIKRPKDQVRVLALCLESKIKEKVAMAHPVWPWLLEWASLVINRYRMDSAGRTGLQRIRGKNAHNDICAFGGCVHRMPLKFGNKKQGAWSR